MRPRLFDAHNHLQDARLLPHAESVSVALAVENVQQMVVNGSSENDWPEVLALARSDSRVIPSFGVHPWDVRERTVDWQSELIRYLDMAPAGIGEIGLDRWIKDFDMAQQEEVFRWQLRLAAERDVPANIHCLQAWGRLVDILQEEPRPSCGFVLHSFGGARELIGRLAELGAYFSLPGYFAHERKVRQRETFKHVPRERLLIETDAPDQPLPEERVQYRLPDASSGKMLNHPANLAAVYQFAAELLNRPLESLATQIEENFRRLFGKLMRESVSRPN
jgi:TatD DNase family protein